MNNSAIQTLYELCIQQPFDANAIEHFIKENHMDSDAVTRSAIKVSEYGQISYGDFLYANERKPEPHELRTYRWETLFDLLIANGLDPTLTVLNTDDELESVLSMLAYFDDGNLGAKIARNILRCGGTPNISIGHHSLFVEVDDNFTTDVLMGLYPEKWQLDNAFRFWLVLIGFGGVMRSGKSPVNMLFDKSPDIFREFEKYDYCIKYNSKDYDLFIFEKSTGLVVATV